MQLAVCDDNTIFLRELEQQLRHIPFVASVRSFSSISALFNSISDGTLYDAVLMGIQWNADLNGLDFAEALFHRSPNTKIIFVTGYTDDYAQQIFLRRANLSGFLSKPVEQPLLEANLRKIADGMHRSTDALLLKANGASVALPFQSIRYLESRGHAVMIHTARDEFTVYEQLQILADRLPPSFIQCHKSFIVNMRYIQRFCAADIFLRSGTRIPVSRSKYLETKAAYFAFVGREL